MNSLPTVFTAATTHGAGRGKRIGTPTINLFLEDVPKGILHGIYACYVNIEGKKYPAVAHYGPRPVFQDTETFEVHLLDTHIEHFPEKLTVELIKYLRDVQDFGSTEALLEAIQKDILEAKSILKSL
jgi:riboflavin kinase/FMN adenylyltransferase